MTEPNTETTARAELAKAHVAAALVAAGTPSALAAHVAAGWKYSAVGNGVLIEAGTLRAVDETESINLLVKSLLAGPVVAAGVPVDDAAGNAAAFAAGKAAGERARAALDAASIAFK